MSTKRNILFEKKRFNVVKKWCADNGIVPQISKLKITRDIENGVGYIDFDLKSNQLSTPGDVALNRNDVFIPFGIGLFLSFDKATPTGKARLYSYAPKAGIQNPVGFMTGDIEALYNGTLEQVVDQTTIMQAFPAELFKHIGHNEPRAMLGSADTVVADGAQGEYDLEDMMHPFTPEIVYQGTMDIKTAVKFNANGSDFSVALASAPTTKDKTHKPRVTLMMIGVLVKNGATESRINDLTDALSKITA